MLLKLGGLFFLVSVVFWLWAIFDCLTCDTKRVRNLPRWAWAVVILVFLEFGALAWVMFGRPRAGQLVIRGNQQPPSRGSRPVGPDDDPDFLRNIRGPEPR
ncbi:MAG: PLD nuclease N-terminal domain-containing protein [Jatrophihabitantaceae bacterium]